MPGLSRARMSVVLITPIGETASAREAYFQYYAAGRPISVKATGE
jgi:hypothetical protein